MTREDIWSGIKKTFSRFVTHAVLFAAGFAVANYGFTEITVRGAQGQELVLKGDQNFERMLVNMYANTFFRGGMMEWLSTKSIYSIEDPKMADALSTELCPDTEGLSEDQWLKARESCAELPVAEKLRSLRDNRQVPFHDIGQRIQVGKQVKEPHRTEDDQANTCRPVCSLGGQLRFQTQTTQERPLLFLLGNLIHVQKKNPDAPYSAQ